MFTIIVVGFALSIPEAVAKELMLEDSLASTTRFAISGGMGVSYVNAPDIADLVNASSLPGQRSSDFKSAVEFYGAADIPLDRLWILKLEYAYLLGTYNVNMVLGTQDFTFVAHMPTVVAQYVLVGERTYNLKVGAGIGYHFGSLETTLGGLTDAFRGSGVGTKIDVEANTAFGENLFGYLGADLRWDFIGGLTNSSGNPPPNSPATASPALHFFSIGAKLGFTYYFQ